jgi:uncharacterized protein (TIGR03086 family)
VNLDLLYEVTEEFAAQLSEVTDGDLTAPTPCTLWTIDDLLDHMLGENANLADALGHPIPPPARPNTYPIREMTYRASAHAVAQALAATVHTRQSPEDLFESHLANTLIHTWDLTQSTQLEFDPPNPRAITITREHLRRLKPDCRGEGQAFAQALDFPAASPMDEVLFQSGRHPRHLR